MTVSGGSPVLASDINEALNRRIGITTAVSDGATTSGATEIVVDTVAGAVKAGRTYTVTAYFPFTGTVAGDEFYVRIRQGSTIGDAQVTYDRPKVGSTSAVYTAKPVYEYTALADGTITFSSTIARTPGGTGTATPKGATSQPRYIKIELSTTE